SLSPSRRRLKAAARVALDENLHDNSATCGLLFLLSPKPMSVLVSLHHVTRYAYERPVALGPQVIRLRPAPHGRTGIASYSQKVTPATHHVNWQNDPHGNWVARYTFPETTAEFSVTVDLHADLAAINPFDFFIDPYTATYPFTLPPDLAHELGGYLD